MDDFSKRVNMKKIIEKIVNFFKSKFKKTKTDDVIIPEVKRLIYSKRTDN
jgi:hypothetical protein